MKNYTNEDIKETKDLNGIITKHIDIQNFNCDLYLEPLWFHKKNLMQTATGYGKALKTEYMIKFNNRKYRILNRCFSNIGCLYIKTKTSTIFINN